MTTRSSKIVVRFTGGLGNQMFQYALGRHLALIHGRELRFDVTGYVDDKPDAQAGVRLFGLTWFRVGGEIATDADLEPFQAHRASGFTGRILRAIDRCTPLAQRRVVQERMEDRWQFRPELLRSNFADPVCLVGLWHSEKYFASIANTIRSELQVKSPAAGENAAMLAEIASTNSVAVHVRHGDNVRVEKDHGALPVSYYQQASKLFQQRINKARYYVFSDDPSWAEANLMLPGETVFVSHNGDEKNHEDLRLMSACKHHIIGNSTFSWWGAWLGNKEGQLVYAPRQYHVAATYTYPDYYPANWTLLPSA